jgi:hypothetical protein
LGRKSKGGRLVTAALDLALVSRRSQMPQPAPTFP